MENFEGKINVMICGGGAREHVLAQMAANSPLVETVHCLGVNAGISRLSKVVKVEPQTDYEKIAVYGRNHGIGLTIIGPEEPLAKGLANVLRRYNLMVFGPDIKAAQLESSKFWAYEFMQRYNIPTASTVAFSSSSSALEKIKSRENWSVVVKYDGLMHGKGVTICQNIAEAKTTLRRLYHKESNAVVLLQEFLPDNPKMKRSEVSLHVVVSGDWSYKILPTVQDYKQRFDGDVGPMTGGMGCYGPVSGVDIDEIEALIVKPTIDGLRKEGINYCGVIFFGLKICPSGPKVIEFNVRFGDPEITVINQLVTNDLMPLFLAATFGLDISSFKVDTYNGGAVSVVMVNKAYPNIGKECTFPAYLDTPNTYHGATTLLENQSVMAGTGRVAVVTNRSPEGVTKARTWVYGQILRGSLEGLDCRKDIGEGV